MGEVFSLFAARDSGYHRLHPLTKLSLAGFLLVTGLVLPGFWATYVTFLAIIVPLAAWAKVLRGFVGAVWKVVLPFVISLFLVQGLFWPGGTPLVGIGPLSFKQEGVIFAVKIVGRILMVLGSFLLLSLTTRPDELMLSLTQRGLPGTIAYIVVATVQIVPRFQAKAATILDAQRSRGLETEGSIVRRMKALIPLVIPLVLGSIVDVEERAIALEARAFNRPGPKTSLLVLHDTRAQAAFRWGLLAVVVGLIAVRVIVGA
jgi:energy-coupling factor transport system permease protein